jgi:hypothetical protein
MSECALLETQEPSRSFAVFWAFCAFFAAIPSLPQLLGGGLGDEKSAVTS